MAKNTAIMTLSEAHKALKICFTAGLPALVRGPSGIGKTELILQMAEDEGPDYGLFELNAALANLPDVGGVLMPGDEEWIDADGNTRIIKAGRYSYPYFMRDKRSGKPAFCFKRGIVCVEEYGQSVSDVKRALAPISWEGRVGEWRFPQGCHVVMLSNRQEDRSGVTKDFDFIINRRVEMEVKAEKDGWLVWAHDHGISNATLAYAYRNELKVFANKAPEEQGPWLTPRSLVSADRFITAALDAGMKLDDMLMWKGLSGIVGPGIATEYIGFAAIRDHLPTISAILADPTRCPLPAELDQQIFLVYDLASKATKENIGQVIKYINRMKSDFSIAFYRSAMQRDSALRSTREFGDWAVKNVSLLSAISGK